MLIYPTRRKIGRIFLYIGICIWIFIVIAPIYWMIVQSLKGGMQIYDMEQKLYPSPVDFENYIAVLFESEIHIYYINSMIVVGASTIISFLVSYFAAYGIIRMRFRGAQLTGRSILFSYLVPNSLLVIPLYVLLHDLRLLDTLTGLTLVYCTISVPFCTWMLMAYIKTVPIDLEDAARIDGCSRIGVMFRILLPVIKPSIVTCIIFAFVLGWDMFLYPMVLITKKAKLLVPIFVSRFILYEGFGWGKCMAASVLVIIPPILLFVWIQRYVSKGLMGGAIKG